MLEATGLVKHYGRVLAVDGVDLHVRAGEIVGMVGNNGAGKTTVIKMLAGLLDPDEGRASLGGEDPRKPAARVELGFLPEDAPLYDHQDAIGYLAFFARLYGLSTADAKKRARLLLRRLRLDEKHWKKRLGELSKGSARKVAIARCMLHDPKVLILDEPTSGLDPASRRDLDAFLRERADAGTAIFLSAHDLKQVETICDRILVMHEGRIRMQGPLAELRQVLGGTTYTLHATQPFTGSTPEGGVHVGRFDGLAALEAAMDQVAASGGTVLDMEGVPPSLDRILAAMEEP